MSKHYHYLVVFDTETKLFHFGDFTLDEKFESATVWEYDEQGNGYWRDKTEQEREGDSLYSRAYDELEHYVVMANAVDPEEIYGESDV